MAGRGRARSSTRRSTRRAPRRRRGWLRTLLDLWRQQRRRHYGPNNHASRSGRTLRSGTGRQRAVEPEGGQFTVADQVIVWLHRAVAWAQDDRPAQRDLGELAHRTRLRVLDRRHTFQCGGHSPPLHFASIADLNQHLTDAHAGPVQHERGKTAGRSRHNPRRPRPTTTGRARPRPQRIDATPPQPPGGHEPPPRPRPDPNAGRVRHPPGTVIVDGEVVDTPAGTGVPANAADTPTQLQLIHLHMQAIESGRLPIMSGEIATIGDIGSMPLTTVSQIREALTAMERLGIAMEEAVIGFTQNARTSEQAPVDAEVLSHLKPAETAAAAFARAMVTTLSAFDEEYAPDIAAAQQGERMDNTALLN